MGGLADGAFEGDLKELLGFDGELHREFVHNLFGIAVDDEADRVLGGDTALAAVEELVLGDFGGGCLMLDDGRGVGYLHVGESVRSATVAEQERVALAVVACPVCGGSDLDKSAVGILAVSGTDALADDARVGVAAEVNHLGAGVRLLVVVGDGDGVELGRGVVAAEDA